MKQIKYNEIKTAKSVKEFRENLQKYFVCVGHNREYLYVFSDRGVEMCDINSIESLSDLYEKYGHSIRVTPTIKFNVQNLSDAEVTMYMWDRDFTEVLQDDSRLKVYEMNSADDTQDYIQSRDASWYGIDNQILRSFYIKVLGNYSGYSLINQEVA